MSLRFTTMYYPVVFTLLLAIFPMQTRCETNTTFLSPSNSVFDSMTGLRYNPTYYVGNDLRIKWEAINTSTYNIELMQYQEDEEAKPLVTIKSREQTSSAQWTVEIPAGAIEPEEGGSYIFFLQGQELPASDEQDNLFYSQNFNVTTKPVPGRREPLSNGAVAGITAGSTVAGILLVVGLSNLACRCRRTLKSLNDWKQAGRDTTQKPKMYTQRNRSHLQELAATQRATLSSEIMDQGSSFTPYKAPLSLASPPPEARNLDPEISVSPNHDGSPPYSNLPA